MKTILLGVSILLLTGCQTSTIESASTNENQTLIDDDTISEPRSLDVIHTDQFVGNTAPAGVDAKPYQEELSIIARNESKRIVQERIQEEARLAEKQRIKEENDRIAAQEAQREKDIAENERAAAIAKQQHNEPVPESTSQKSNKTNTDTSPEPIEQPPAPVQNRTDGFNFKGHHFALSTFSGSGQVPIETPYVYQWTDYPKHYLIERVSPAGRVIQQVQLGDQITINGNTYTVHSVVRGVDAELETWNVIDNNPSSISFQTCELGKGINDISLLTLWFAS